MKRIVKISLSRKGFDATAGGQGSPVIDNRYISLPIPEAGSGLFYNQLKLDGKDISFLNILRQLGATQYSECHMDPNLCPELYGLKKEDGWKPAFGQDGNAVSHLLNEGFKPGDIFLFFGRFQIAQIKDQKFVWTKKAKPFHAIYGFMEVGEIVKISTQLNSEHLKKYGSHPHIKMRNSDLYSPRSTLFIPAEKSKHNFNRTYGIFNFHRDLVLTEEGFDLSNWLMPKAFRNKEFTTIGSIDKSGVKLLRGQGQEFVGVADKDLINWIKEMIQKHT